MVPLVMVTISAAVLLASLILSVLLPAAATTVTADARCDRVPVGSLIGRLTTLVPEPVLIVREPAGAAIVVFSKVALLLTSCNWPATAVSPSVASALSGRLKMTLVAVPLFASGVKLL